MNAGSLEGALRLQKLLVFSIISLLVLVLGYTLADDAFFAAFAFGGLAWLMLMPYHATLSVVCAVATFSTALILPFFPGRPFIWEAAALLGWTGCVLVFSFRQYRDEMWDSIFEHKWMLLGVAGYCGVLVFTMMERGVGFRTMGGSQMGGRFYFQQLTCAIFPLLFIMVRLKEEQIRKLFIIQCALSATWVISDVIYSNAPGLFNILFFLEVPGDARNFEMERMKMGINRYQSLAFVSIGFLWLLLIKNKLNDFLTSKGVWLIPASLAIVGAGLLSGHRYTVVIIILVISFMVFTQRLITMRNAMAGTLCVGPWPDDFLRLRRAHAARGPARSLGAARHHGASRRADGRAEHNGNPACPTRGGVQNDVTVSVGRARVWTVRFWRPLAAMGPHSNHLSHQPGAFLQRIHWVDGQHRPDWHLLHAVVSPRRLGSRNQGDFSSP